jgi:hypothetical protein
MRIFAAHDGGSGCAYYRMMVPLEELNRQDGFDVTFADAGDTHHPPSITARDLASYHVIVGQRLNKFDGMGVWRRARTPFSRLIYDLDDDVWNVSPENFQAWHLYNRPDIQEAVAHTAQVSDLITVTTPYLASVMTERTGNPATAVLPNSVPGWVCDMPREPGRRLTAGWQGGASHGADIGLIAEPVRRFLKRFPRWDLRLAGTDYRPSFKVPDDRARFSRWVQVNDDPKAYFETLDFDIGLAPLLDTAFNRAKSAIKAVEYFARGIPVIASDVGPYRDVIEHGHNGFLVKEDGHSWLRYLSDLATDETLRLQMGENARRTARERWTIEDNADQWAAAYRALFPHGAP